MVKVDSIGRIDFFLLKVSLKEQKILFVETLVERSTYPAEKDIFSCDNSTQGLHNLVSSRK